MSKVLIVAALFLSLQPAVHAADNTAAARAHYRTGTKLYNLGRYAEAAKEYEAAYEMKDDPALLFNIGQAYRAGGDAASALRSYRSYLRAAPNAENRALVEERISELQKTIDQQTKAKDSPPQGTLTIEAPKPAPESEVAPLARPAPPTEPASRSARTQRLAGLGLAGGGAAAIIAGAIFVSLAKSTSDEIARPGTFSPSTQDRLRTYETLEIVSFAVAGAAIAGGVALFLLGRAHGSPHLALTPAARFGQFGALVITKF